MLPNRRVFLCTLGLLLVPSTRIGAEEPPVIPVGLDAYRQWERWPYQRIGRALHAQHLRPRAAATRAPTPAISSTSLPTTSTSRWTSRARASSTSPATTTGTAAPGTTRWMAPTTSSRRPAPPTRTDPRPGLGLPAREAFPQSAGLDLVGHQGRRPDRGCRCRSSSPFAWPTRAPTTARATTSTTSTSREPSSRGRSRAWDGKTPPDADVLELIAAPAATSSRGPTLRREAGRRAPRSPGKLALPAKDSRHTRPLTHGPAMLRALEFYVPREQAMAFCRARLRVTWDDRGQPRSTRPWPCSSAPGTLYNRDGREYLVKGFPVNVRYDGERVHLACYFPMPFFRSARIELVGPATEADRRRALERALHALPRPGQPRRLLPRHLRATIPAPEPGKDLVAARHSQGRGQRRLVGASGRARRSSSRTGPCSTRWRATRASSSTTA